MCLTLATASQDYITFRLDTPSRSALSDMDSNWINQEEGKGLYVPEQESKDWLEN